MTRKSAVIMPVMLYKIIMATAVVGDGPNTSLPPPDEIEPFFTEFWSRVIMVMESGDPDPIKPDASWVELLALVMVKMTSNPRLPTAWKMQ